MNYDLDLQRFWSEQKESQGKPWRTDKPRAPIGIPVDDHWLIEEMGIPSTIRYYEDVEYRLGINKTCNDRVEAAIGIRPFGERHCPGTRRIEEVFGSVIVLTEGGTPWLEPGVETPEELDRLLDRVEARDLREYLVTEEWVDGRKQFQEKYGIEPKAGGGSRGPATIGTSVCGTQNYLMWLMDAPRTMARFTDLLATKLIEFNKILAEATNHTIRGYGWADDNCCLLSPSLYREFCYPVLERVFNEFAPNPEDNRFQHSDSAMGHLMPMLNELGLKGANFGPTVHPSDIRTAMPNTLIHGQVAPMTLRNGTPEEIIEAIRRDFDAVGGDGGLVLTTAGSVAAGTSLENLQIYMWAVDEYCRYDR